MARGPIEDIYALTDVQRAMLVRCATFPDLPLYMGQWWALLTGPLDTTAFGAAWAAVIARHPALRSGFHWELKGGPAQVVASAPAFDIQRFDWRARQDWRSALNRFLAQDRARPFDIRRPPLMRISLLDLGPERRLFVWTRHHLAVDGWSLGEILEEALTLYRGGTPPAALPFRRYVEWAQNRDLSAALGYWRTALAGAHVARAKKPDSRPSIAEVALELAAADAARLDQLARAERLTLSTLIEIAWALALSRAQGADEVLFGCVETVRPADLLGSPSAHLIGPQIGVLPSRVRCDDRPLRVVLREHQSARAAGRDAGPVGLDAVRDILGLPGDAPPLFSLIAVQTYPLEIESAFKAAGLEVSASGDVTLPDMPLNLMVEIGDALQLKLMFDRQYASEGQARQLLDMLATALQKLPEQLDAPANDFEALPEALRQKIDTALKGPPLPMPADTVLDVILQKMRAQPDRPAIIAQDRVWSYAELGDRAGALAERLVAAGFGSGSRVGIELDHGPDAVAAILGVLLAGAAYVPFDPDAPRERRDMIRASAKISALVARDAIAGRDAGVPAFTVNAEESAGAPAAAINHARASDEAYVIFTSGSTGRPKGVSVGHDNLRYHVAANAAQNADLPIGRFLLTFPFFFDGSVTGLFCTLCDGGALVLPSPQELRDVDGLLRRIRDDRATHVCMTPSLWVMLLAAAGPGGLPSVQMAKVAAEACAPAVVEAHAARVPQAALCNEYGPTEATVWVCVERCRPETTGAVVPIGRPIPGARLIVVDELGRPCPFETVGELLVAGPAVARAYVGAPEGVTLRTPLPGADPFASEAAVYRTGDRVSLGFDGRLYFHGRRDRQVKLRGYRVEPGEIEAALLDQPGILEAAVLVDESERLVAHLGIGPDAPDDEILRGKLAGRLPGYMIPQNFVRQPRLPRAANGKIDLAALAALRGVARESRPDEAPRTPLEQALAKIWGELLGGAQVTRQDDFFALGGGSLLAMQMIARVRRELSLPAALADVLDAPQLARLAARLGDPAATRAREPALATRQRARVELPS